MSTKRLLGIFAHPDDESLIGGTLLHYHEAGVETGLVFATRGEVGEISDDSILSPPSNLEEIREAEAQAAAAILRIGYLRFLDYRDSGRSGTPDNQHAHCLKRARAAEVIGKLVATIREFRPDVLITFDEAGGYGHPDHVLIYRYATGAFHAAADEFEYPELGPAHSAAKLYYCSISRRQATILHEWLQEEAGESFFKGVNIDQLGLADEQISVVMDVERWRSQKMHAAAQHRTRKNPNTPLLHLPEELQQKWYDTEYFQLATSRVGDDVIGENDLFAHVS